MKSRWLVVAVAVHSLVLGMLMLLWPLDILRVTGWEYGGTRFFPAQSGLFLLILGIVYLGAVQNRSFAWMLVLSKALAVAFLVFEAATGSCPPIVFLTAALDGAMGAAVAALLLSGRL